MSRRSVPFTVLGLLCCVLVTPGLGGPQKEQQTGSQGNIQIALTKKFIQDYKDRVTIDADDFIIDKAHKQPNPASKDGDIHVAGRAESIGLPIVAEVMNAKFQKAALKRIHAREGTGQKIKVSGA